MLVLKWLSGDHSYTWGIVWISIVMEPHSAPAQLAIQSAQSGSCSPPTTRSPPCGMLLGTPAGFFVPPPPHAAATSAMETNRVRRSLPLRMRRTCRNLLVPAPWPRTELLEPNREDDRCEREDDGGGDGDAVEVALDDGGAGSRAPHAAAEHVGEAPAPPAVQQDEQHEQERDGDVDDDHEGGQHCAARLPIC